MPDREWLLRHRRGLIVFVLATGMLLAGLWLVSATFREWGWAIWHALHLENDEALRRYFDSLGNWAPPASVLLMIAQALIAPVPLSVIALANGLAFGVIGGTLISLVGYLAAALLSFGLARAFGRTLVERIMGRDQKIPVGHWLEKYGIWALFLVRLLPGMPSDLMSFVAGMSRMPVSSYTWVTIAGFLPQAFLYALVGDRALQFVWLIFAGSALITGGIGAVIWWQNRNRQPQGELTRMEAQGD
jgi:uncharacterized membrane protein YdjX (TVP38/TMEM64 family)